jgi:midasin
MEQDAESTRAALEALRVEHPGEAGAELWRKFESLTADLAQELCEQLRLILEPSLATKLKGDYRSGKRINMKKVIPYIASQFKKDKIWLRRTKPHKRAYQIMVAIDDSKSMANNHSGQIACEALATIAAAMARLEVGEVGVVKFGADVELLHPLGQPFTDEAGARVLSQFTFSQNKDDFSLLLTRLVSTLQHARSSAAQGEHLQLSFIVSDGWLVLQQHRELNKWIREAAAQGILLVFIIIDSPNKKNSILETTSIEVTGGQVSTTPYLDKFPFPYYIVLREITTLPVVLADALRQWFELVQRMEEQ